MAYIKPAVQVYQDLINAGGAAQLNPDMPACIVGTARTIIGVDFADSVDLARSLGSTDDTTQTDAAFDVYPAAANTEIYSNVASRSPGQVVDTSSYTVWAKNPVIKNLELTGTWTNADLTISAISVSQPLGGNIGNTLPYNSSFNHASLGDTITDSVDFVGYISGIDYTVGGGTGEIKVTKISGTNPSDASVTAFSVYRKFGQVAVAQYTPGASGVVDASVFAGAVSGNTSIYGISSELQVEGTGDQVSFYIGYQADRADLSSQILTINDVTDLTNQLGEISPNNPLAYGVSLALANSGGTAIKAIALDPGLGGLAAHTKATELAEGGSIYMMVPMTTNLAYHGVYHAHVSAMSQPGAGAWRVCMTNCDLPTEQYIIPGVTPMVGDGADEDDIPDALLGGTPNGTSIQLPRGANFGATVPGNEIKVVTVGTDSFGEPTYAYKAYVVQSVSGDTAVVNTAFTETPDADGKIYFYVGRTLQGTNSSDKQVQADWVAAQAGTWQSNRMWMFPGEVDIPNADGLNDRLPGYYLQCALAGFISGTPAQQPITNVAIAGISDIVNGNFYFTQNQMNTMAGAGTLLYAQAAQGTTPYCRHGLTTDVSVLEYREILKVKNWDYLSYYYKDILAPFIGQWNITPDTLQTIRQTVTSASESLLLRKLPKIGAPLLSYSITSLTQSEAAADAIDLFMSIAIVNPNNYTNVHLQI